MRTLLAGGASVAMALVPTVAFAQNRGDWLPDTHRSGAGAEIYLWDHAIFGTTFPTIAFANIEAVETFFIDAYLPFNAVFDSRFDGVTRAGLGNPTVAFRWAPTHGIVRWWLGGGIGAPLGALDDDDYGFALTTATVATAYYDAHLWAIDAIPGHVTGGADIRAADFLSIQAEAKVSPWIPIADRVDVEVILQNRVGVELRHPTIGIGGGAHVKVVWLPTTNAPFGLFADEAQVSIEPHFAYTNEVFFVRLGLLQALDAPLGVFDDDEDSEVVSGHLTIGGSWD